MKYRVLNGFMLVLSILLGGQAFHAKTLTTTDPDTGFSVIQFPAIPAELTVPADRAGFLALHFWDNLDCNDTIYAHDRDFNERNFVNFLSILPIAEPDTARAAVDSLMDKVAVDSVMLAQFDELAENYLAYFDSPVYDNELFIYFLEYKLGSDKFDATQKTRAEFLLEDAKLNRAGSVANDFTVEDLEGNVLSLSSLCQSGDRVVLMFYDPTCEDCHTALWELSHEPQFADLKIIAVYDGDDLEVWRQDAERLLHYRNTAFYHAVDSVEEGGLYSIPVTPTIFLLDSERRVLLKNTTTPGLTRFLR